VKIPVKKLIKKLKEIKSKYIIYKKMVVKNEN